MKRFFLFILTFGIFLSAPVFASTYATWDTVLCDANITLSGGNLTATGDGGAAGDSCLSNVGKSSGKWYWEITIVSADANGSLSGIGTSAKTLSTWLGNDAVSYGYYSANGRKFFNSANLGYGATYTTGDVIGVALNMDDGEIEFFKNGTTQGVAYTGISGTFYAGMSAWATNSLTANFGATPFSYTEPFGFNAGLCAESECAGSGFEMTTSTAIFVAFLDSYLLPLGILGGALLFLAFGAMLYKTIVRLQLFNKWR